MSNYWQWEGFPSGTEIVSLKGAVRTPHYYIYANERTKTCYELRDWLNDSEIPDWFESLERVDFTEVKGKNGIRIFSPETLKDGRFLKIRTQLIDALINKQRPLVCPMCTKLLPANEKVCCGIWHNKQHIRG